MLLYAAIFSGLLNAALCSITGWGGGYPPVHPGHWDCTVLVRVSIER